MGYFTDLFNNYAYPLLEDAFAIEIKVYPAGRKSKDIEEITINGLLYDPATSKQIVVQDQYKSEMTTMAVRINRQLAITQGITHVVLDDAQIEIFGEKFLVKSLSNSDEVFIRIIMDRIETKEIGDRGRRDY